MLSEKNMFDNILLVICRYDLKNMFDKILLAICRFDLEKININVVLIGPHSYK